MGLWLILSSYFPLFFCLFIIIIYVCFWFGCSSRWWSHKKSLALWFCVLWCCHEATLPSPYPLSLFFLKFFPIFSYLSLRARVRIDTREMLFQVACASLLCKLGGKSIGSQLQKSSISGDLKLPNWNSYSYWCLSSPVWDLQQCILLGLVPISHTRAVCCARVVSWLWHMLLLFSVYISG